MNSPDVMAKEPLRSYIERQYSEQWQQYYGYPFNHWCVFGLGHKLSDEQLEAI